MMKIAFRVGENIVFVLACDFCGAHTVPEGGTELYKQSTISSSGSIPVYHLCKNCGKVKFSDYDNK